jgi:hypothetical protein
VDLVANDVGAKKRGTKEGPRGGPLATTLVVHGWQERVRNLMQI